MKKKFLSLILCITLLSSFISFSCVSAAQNAMTKSGETCLFSEDFDDRTGATLGSAYPRGPIPSTDADGHIFWNGDVSGSAYSNSLWDGKDSTYALMTCSGQSGNASRDFGVFVPTDQRPTSGIVHTSFDFNVYSVTGRTEALTQLDIKVFQNNSYYGSGSQLVGERAPIFAVIGVNEWYALDIYTDLDNHNYLLTVTRYNNGAVVYTTEGECNLSNFGGFSFAMTKNGTSKAWQYVAPKLDNIWIGTVDNLADTYIAVPGEKTLYSNTFEAAASSDWNDNDALTSGGFRTYSNRGIIDGLNSKRAISPSYGGGTAASSVEWYRPSSSEPASAGIYHISFNFKPGTYATVANTIKLYTYNSTVSGTKKLQGASITALDTSVLNGLGNIWLKVDIALAEGDKAIVNVTNASTGVSLHNASIDAGSITKFYAIAFDAEGTGTDWTRANAPAVDNFYVGVGCNVDGLRTILLSDNFDSYTNSDISSWYNSADKRAQGGYNSWTRTIGTTNAISGVSGKSVAFALYMDNKSRSFEYYVGSDNLKQTMGQIQIQFDWRKGSASIKDTILVGAGDTAGSANTYIVPIPTATLATLPDSVWYSVDLIIDFDMNKYDCRLYRINNGDLTVAYSGSGNYAGTNGSSLKDFGYIQWSCEREAAQTWGEPGSSAIDNLYIAKTNVADLSVSLSGSTITADANIRNFMLTQAKPSVLIIGQYDSNNQLVKVDFATQSDVSANTIAGGAKSTTATKHGSATTVTAFLWNDLIEIHPITQSKNLGE